MDPQTLASYATQLKGAPLSMLFVMVELDRPTGPAELVHFTGYSTHTVRNGLSRLAFMDLAQRHRRYHGWTLTPRGRELFRRDDVTGHQEAQTHPDPQPDATVTAAIPQPAAPGGDGEHLPVPAPHSEPDGEASSGEDARPPVNETDEGEFSSPERQKIPVAPCSSRRYTHGSSTSSLSSQSSEPRDHELPTTTCQTDRQNLPVAPPYGPLHDPQAEAAAAALRACGCPGRTWDGKGARDAVEQAMAFGWSGAEVLEAVQTWFAYIDSPAGHTIRSKGFFTMSRLRIGEMAPPRATWATAGTRAESSAAARDALARSYIEAQYRRIVQH